MAVLDSGARREFESGAVRDICEGKGRCDLLPFYEVNLFLYDPKDDDVPIFRLIEMAIEKKDPNLFVEAAKFFSNENFKDLYTALLEVSKHFEDGAIKYGDNNWRKGIPAHCYLDSGLRHYIKFKRGDIDERHDRAFVWNMMCLTWTLRNKPELNDIWVTDRSNEQNEKVYTASSSFAIDPIMYP